MRGGGDFVWTLFGNCCLQNLQQRSILIVYFSEDLLESTLNTAVSVGIDRQSCIAIVPQPTMPNMKIVFVGDANVGKTALFTKFLSNETVTQTRRVSHQRAVGCAFAPLTVGWSFMQR